MHSATSAAHPNVTQHVLMVVIDDLGYDDLGFRNNGQIKTPTFNKLHAEGIDLTSYYTQPSCSPTRAALLTGRKPLHTGINFWLPNIAAGLALDEVTVANVLNRRNFISHAVGKWHLGFHKTPFTPTFRGFSSFFGYYEGSEDYFTHVTSGGFDMHDEPAMFCGKGCTQRPWHLRGQYSTNLFSTRAVEIIRKHDAASKGLFLYLAYQGVHWPREAPAHYVAPYAKTIRDPDRRTFAGMIAALDEGLGNVTAALTARRMLSSTLVIVTTDNGGPTTECSSTGQSNWPYRGSKCSLWEGGCRGTAFIWWAGLPAASRGQAFRGLAHAADLLPTIVSAVGSRLWPNETLPLDGIDLWATLLSNGTSPRTSVYYGISQQHDGPAVRDAAGYKLLLGGTGGGKGTWSPQQLPNTSSPSESCARDGIAPGGGGEACRTPHARAVEEEEDAQGSSVVVEAAEDGRPPADGAAGAAAPLLFYLPSDSGEHQPLDLKRHADVVGRLSALAARYQAGAVPQVTGDPTCPDFAPLDSPEGKWIGPWCDDV